ncbi:MAG: hypothetical protein EPO11_02175 [Gammaproteobacteria bacterium]|nr:MAG: hypothetical protein EPO11_02175 [Gammaproteobacteria bacterium]
MKIKAIEVSSKKPLSNMKIQLQVKGKESGYLSITTDQRGEFYLDDKYKGQQIAAMTGGSTGSWMTASDGGTLAASSTATSTTKSKETTQKETWK